MTEEYVVRQIPYAAIVAGDNDRKKFAEGPLLELAASIAEEGLLQPLTLRPLEGGLWQIVAGERRFRAIGLLGWETVPAVIRDMDDEKASAAMLAENLKRVDLNPIEEARAYHSRMERFGWGEKLVAEKAHVTTNMVSLRLSLLTLAEDLQDLVASEQLKPAYAQILAWYKLDLNFQRLAVRELLANPSPQVKWFNRICADLQEKQNQAYLWQDMGIFDEGAMTFLMEVEEVEKEPPPTPLDSEAPAVGATAEEILKGQIAFWEDAAEEWDELCDTRRQRQCESAVVALRQALAATVALNPAGALFSNGRLAKSSSLSFEPARQAGLD